MLGQLFLFNRSPHLQEMHTDLFDRFRTDRMLRGARMNTLYAVQRAVAELGFCHPPHHRTGAHNLRAVQTLLGHESGLTTGRYTAVDDSEVRATAACAW